MIDSRSPVSSSATEETRRGSSATSALLHDSVLERSGVVVIDKPTGLTSHDVVSRVRRIMGTRKVGHSGTLDPMATGVLVLGVQRATKFLAHIHADDKRYEATVRLGSFTVTDDREGEEVWRSPYEAIAGLDIARIRKAFSHYVGDIMQRPSSVSSIKINGRRAHELVREGTAVHLPERPVQIYSLEVGSCTRHISGDSSEAYWDIQISVHCSAGTYIRALARDVGAELNVGGHLRTLRRTSAGDFDIIDSVTLDELQESPRFSFTLDAAMMRCFPIRRISQQEAKDISLGKWLQPEGRAGVYAVVSNDGTGDKAIALVQEKGARAASVFVARPEGLV